MGNILDILEGILGLNTDLMKQYRTLRNEKKSIEICQLLKYLFIAQKSGRVSIPNFH